MKLCISFIDNKLYINGEEIKNNFEDMWVEKL